MTLLSVIIPAHNEAGLIGRCLDALLTSTPPGTDVEVIVVANGCTDSTVAEAELRREDIEALGWLFEVADLPEGGKIGALNVGDTIARGNIRAYLDADVTVSPELLSQTVVALDVEAPRYASGQVRIVGSGWVARTYARFWSQVPFMAQTVPGCGYFAMNRAGRSRWGIWPPIIADDLFARLNFASDERVALRAPYRWPIAEGVRALVRVRRRQDAGVTQLAQTHPELMANEDKPTGRGTVTRALRDPLGFAVYATVALAVRLKRPGTEWSRGR